MTNIRGQGSLETMLISAVIISAAMFSATLFLKPALNAMFQQAVSFMEDATNKLVIP